MLSGGAERPTRPVKDLDVLHCVQDSSGCWPSRANLLVCIGRHLGSWPSCSPDGRSRVAAVVSGLRRRCVMISVPPVGQWLLAAPRGPFSRRPPSRPATSMASWSWAAALISPSAEQPGDGHVRGHRRALHQPGPAGTTLFASPACFSRAAGAGSPRRASRRLQDHAWPRARARASKTARVMLRGSGAQYLARTHCWARHSCSSGAWRALASGDLGVTTCRARCGAFRQVGWPVGCRTPSTTAPGANSTLC